MDANSDHQCVAFFHYLQCNSFKYQVSFAEILPLILLDSGGKIIGCNSCVDRNDLATMIYTKIMTNFGCNTVYIIPIELSVCSNGGFEPKNYSSFLSVNVLNNSIEYIFIKPGVNVNRLQSINKYFESVFSKENPWGLFYVGINVTLNVVPQIKGISTFSGLCNYYKAYFEPQGSPKKIARHLSREMELMYRQINT